MIECEICGKFFHPDEISKCPECGSELCPECYKKHVNICLLGEQREPEDFDD